MLEVRLVLAPALTLSGRLVDAGGAPLAHAAGMPGGYRIAVSEAGAGDPRAPTRLEKLTKVHYAEGGRFHVSGLLPGAYDLWVAPQIESFYTFSGAQQCFPALAAGSAGLELRVAAPEDVTVHLRTNVDPELARKLVVLHARVTPRGTPPWSDDTPRELRVAGTSGWPEGALYRFKGCSAHDDAHARYEIGYYDTTDLGEHTLPRLGEGWYVFGVEPRGEQGARPYFPAATGPIYITPGETDIRFELVRRTSVRGTVHGAGTRRLALALLDGDGRRIPLEGGPGGSNPRRVLPLASDGAFELLGAPVGSFVLQLGTPLGLSRGDTLREVEVEFGEDGSEPLELFVP